MFLRRGLCYDILGNITPLAKVIGTTTYDGNGLRVKKVSGATTTVYIFSGSKARCLRPGGPCGMIAEYDNGAVPTAPSREYIYSGSALLAKIDSTGTKYYHQDHLSNRLVTDSTGTATAQMDHYPFGESWYNASNDKLLFTSYERDSESGNDYAQARYYLSRLGRFSSPDPLSGSTDNPQSLNRYSYVLSVPTSLVDPTGRECVFFFEAKRHPKRWDNRGAEVGPSDVEEAEAEPQFVDDVCGGGGGGGLGFGGALIFDDPCPPGTICVTVIDRPPADPPPLPPSLTALPDPFSGGGPDGAGRVNGAGGDSSGGRDKRFQCAIKFGQQHSLAAGIGAIFGDKVGNNFVTQLLFGNTVSSLAKIGTDVFGNTTPTGSQVASMALKGVAQGVPIPGASLPVTGPVAPIRNAAVGAAVSAGFNVVAGVGQETLELGISASKVASAVSPLAQTTVQSIVGNANLAKFGFDAATFAYGYLVACAPKP